MIGQGGLYRLNLGITKTANKPFSCLCNLLVNILNARSMIFALS
jgi:hypothetical protein